MGSFSNTVFSILLGWIQSLVSIIWSAFTAKDGGGFFQFIGQNWIKITVLFCIIGVAADFMVYVFRWKPYKVWGTFFRHLKRKDTETAENEQAQSEESVIRENHYFRRADNDIDDLYRWRDEETEQTEDTPGEVTKAGYTVPADSPYRRPLSYEGQIAENSGTFLKPEKIRRRRTRLTGILGDSGVENEYHYFAPQPVIDQKEAYHSPVFPEKWKESGEGDK